MYERMNRESEALRESLGLPPLYFDPDGNPIELGDWARLNASEEQREANLFIAQIEHNGWDVLTLWRGLRPLGDYREHPTVCFTVVWAVLYGVAAFEEGYPNRHAALAGHDQIVEMVKRWRRPDCGGLEDAQESRKIRDTPL